MSELMSGKRQHKAPRVLFLLRPGVYQPKNNSHKKAGNENNVDIHTTSRAGTRITRVSIIPQVVVIAVVVVVVVGFVVY